MANELTNNQLAVLSLLNVVGPNDEFAAMPLLNGDICILHPGKDEPLITIARFDFDNLLERFIFVPTATAYSEDETEKFASKFRLRSDWP